MKLMKLMLNKRNWLRNTLIFSLSASFVFLFNHSVYAVHAGAGGLVCGACHTMHNSEGDAGMEGSPSIVLVRAAVGSRSQMHKLCLQCHSTSGSQPATRFAPHGEEAPKVHDLTGNLTWDQTMPFNKIGAGGFFNYILNSDFTLKADDAVVALGYGHSVGITVAALPPGAADGSITGFTCTNCHDPHGTSVLPGNSTVNAYRNLKKTPTGSGFASVAFSAFTGSYIGGVTGTYVEPNSYYTPEIAGAAVSIWPIYKDLIDFPPRSNFYEASDSGMGRWCANCHDTWHQEVGGVGVNKGSSDWNRHPVDIGLDGSGIGGAAVNGFGTSGSGVPIIDWNHYNTFEDCTVTADCRKLPAADAGGMFYYYADDPADKVFCLSCHFAHGGPYLDSLRWNYTSAVSAGSQRGLGINSTTGCQQCHNR